MLLDLLLPERCLVCRRGGEQVCGECLDRLPRIRPPLCERCGAPTAWPVARCSECSGRRLAFASARAALVYDASVRAIVSSWKERGLHKLASVAADVVAETLPRPDVAALAVVPPDAERRRKRGHHPAGRLGAELADRWQLPVEQPLRRARAVAAQRGLTLAGRRRNVAGAFVAAARAPTRMCLVDDVYTSGATANAAASALRKGGARRVEVVTFARAVRAYTV